MFSWHLPSKNGLLKNAQQHRKRVIPTLEVELSLLFLLPFKAPSIRRLIGHGGCFGQLARDGLG